MPCKLKNSAEYCTNGLLCGILLEKGRGVKGVAGKNQIDDAELCYYLDRLIMLTQKGLIHWQCSECCGPIVIPTENEGECAIQDIQLCTEYNGKRYELDVTEMIFVVSKKVDMFVLVRFADIAPIKGTYAEEARSNRKFWSSLLELYELAYLKAKEAKCKTTEYKFDGKLHMKVMERICCKTDTD